ncbi:hypothetical protein PRIPAC_74767 [Pristionchus pacificus]|uniref:Uncharacterized protein n=1 Tax=Pristionchus pacificus TaxID=54126 RepID=A0A2A6B4B0_PRIPA|nr:hypothetical protein PRIPAC_74767 [Pristionchus pacificus]|eukprot:PDM60704.1 hypothetical protein PRIPAC_54510 [Pristionchus pacificus]
MQIAPLLRDYSFILPSFAPSFLLPGGSLSIMVKKRYTVIPTKKRAPLVENIDSFNQVRRNSGPSVTNVGTPMPDQQARQHHSCGIKRYCVTTGTGTYEYATAEERNAAAEAYCDRVEASYRARGVWYFDKKFKKMSYDLTKEELASYDQKTPSLKDSEGYKVSGGDAQKTSSTKDEEKTTVAAEQEINPVISKESKKAMGASSEKRAPLVRPTVPCSDLFAVEIKDQRSLQVENIDSFNQVRRNSGPSVTNVGMPMPDQQARQHHSCGINRYCMTTGTGTYEYATAEEANAAAEAYCDRVEASYRARGVWYFDRKFKKMSYDLTKEELASYDQKTPSLKDSEGYKVSVGDAQKTSSTKEEEKTTVAAEQETNPGIPKESKKAMGASSEVDPPISKDLSSFAAGDCPEVEDANKIDQVDPLKGEFHISFESKDSPDVVKTTEGSVKGEESKREGEAELRASINKGMRRGFLLPKAPDFKKADSLILNDCIPSFEAGDCPNVTNVTSTDDSLLPKELHLSYSAADDCLEATKKRDDPVNGEEADSLVLNHCIPSFEAGDCPNVTNVTSTDDSLLPKELHLSYSAADDCLEATKKRDDPVNGEEDEEEWHDEDIHGSFNPADPKCKCAIS